MQQLTGLDGAFLAMEIRHGVRARRQRVHPRPPHRAGAAHPRPPDRRDRVAAAAGAAVPPPAGEVPLGLDQPYWIEDPDFDIEFHVRELALPAPGNDAQLAEQVGRLHARPLDRSRPLWELYLIHGLAGGRAAVYTKVHHAAIDGVSGNDLLAAAARPHPGGPRPAPGRSRSPADAAARPVACSAAARSTAGPHPVRAARLTDRAGPLAAGAGRWPARPAGRADRSAGPRRRGR